MSILSIIGLVLLNILQFMGIVLILFLIALGVAIFIRFCFTDDNYH